MRILILLLAGTASYAQTTIGSRTAASGATMDFSAASTALGRTTGEIVPTWPSFTGIWDANRFSVGAYPLASQFGNNATPIPEALVGLLNIPSNSAGGNHGAGVAGYARTASSNVGSVGLFGFGGVNANSTSSFGLNTVTTNCGAPQCATQTGFTTTNQYGYEMDFNIMKLSGGANPNSNLRGLYMIGASEAKGSGINYAIDIDSFGYLQSPKLKWDSVFRTEDGVTSLGVDLGTNASGNAVGSQAIQLRSRTTGGVNNTYQIQADPDGNSVYQTNVFGVGGAHVFLDGAGNHMATFGNGVTSLLYPLTLTSLAGGGALHAACVDNVGLLQNGSCGGSGTSRVCLVTRTSSTVLTIAATASSTTPCNLGNTQFTSPATCTISANGGTAYIEYYIVSGSLLCGYGGGTFAGGNVTGSGATAVFGTTAFHKSTDGYIAIASATATSGTWDVSGVNNRLQEAGSQNFIQGTNITLTKTATGLTIDSSSSFSDFETNSTIAMTGSDVALTTAVAAPALAAGKCYEIRVVVSNQSGLTTQYFVKVDSTTIYSPYSGGALPNSVVSWTIKYCNNQSSQTAQTILGDFLNYAVSGTVISASATSSTATLATPTGVNWASGHNITLTGNAASGNITQAGMQVVLQ